MSISEKIKKAKSEYEESGGVALYALMSGDTLLRYWSQIELFGRPLPDSGRIYILGLDIVVDESLGNEVRVAGMPGWDALRNDSQERIQSISKKNF